MTQVVKIELVSGRPNISVNLYADGLTPPSAAWRTGALIMKAKSDGRSLFTRNLSIVSNAANLRKVEGDGDALHARQHLICKPANRISAAYGLYHFLKSF